MAEAIPFLPGVPHQSLECTINGVTRIFEARWNTRDDSWYLNVLEVDEEPILMGIKLRLGVEMGRSCTHELFASGARALVAIDFSGRAQEAGLDDLGTRVAVVYFTEVDKFLAQVPQAPVPREPAL